jgi:alkylation response protein AidB-like acyl-CoA dehydrogenase
MYRAPIRELRFVIHELIGDRHLSGAQGLADYSEELADAVLDQAARFAEEVLAPLNRIGDVAGAKWTPDGVRMPPEYKNAYAQYARDGWPQLRVPAEVGGQGAPAILGTAVEELWASANLAFKLCPMLSQAAIEAIHRCGSDEQRRRYLPKLISGEWTGTMNLTEAQAGSDLGAIKTRAVPDGGRYRIFGQKIFITYGDHDYTSNIVHMVLARIEGAPAGTKGISMFIVPKVLVNADGTLGARNDVSCVSIEHKLGIHASPTCVLSYGDGEGAVGELVGEPNHGLEYMFIMMNAARLAVGLEGYAVAERAYQHALAYARERVQGRAPRTHASAADEALPIVHHPDVRRMLLAMKAYADAARALALYASLQLDLAEHHDDAAIRAAALARGELLIPIVKGWSTETGILAASLGIQVHGGMGFIEETGAAQYLRDVRITTIYEGTTGIQANDLLGRKLGRDDGAALQAFIDEIETQLSALQAPDAGVARAVKATAEAVAQWRNVSRTLLRSYDETPEAALAVAVPYLMMSGIVIGAWLMTKSLDIAARQHARDAAFYGGKRQIARYYLEHVLPEAAALAKVIGAGGGSIVDADPALL